jgi:mannose-6-phosphate isomerase-like protein (cupin superfamily)
MMVEEVREHPSFDGAELLAIIIRGRQHKKGTTFVTPKDAMLQVAFIQRDAGEVIPTHKHVLQQRTINKTQEVLIIRSGRMQVDFYSLADEHVTSKELKAGDVLILLNGGHAFKALEDMECVEVKQGPYLDKNSDKVML